MDCGFKSHLMHAMPYKDKTKQNEYLNEYMKKRYSLRRQEAIEKLGGKCVDCNSQVDLEFDHINPSEKSVAIAKASSFSNKRWNEEIVKCVLRCINCHKARHYGSVANNGLAPDF